MNIQADTTDAGALVRAIEVCAGILAGAHPEHVATARNVLLALPDEHRMFPRPGTFPLPGSTGDKADWYAPRPQYGPHMKPRQQWRVRLRETVPDDQLGRRKWPCDANAECAFSCVVLLRWFWRRAYRPAKS
jgi:hypothetical protein